MDRHFCVPTLMFFDAVGLWGVASVHESRVLCTVGYMNPTEMAYIVYIARQRRI